MRCNTNILKWSNNAVGDTFSYWRHNALLSSSRDHTTHLNITRDSVKYWLIWDLSHFHLEISLVTRSYTSGNKSKMTTPHHFKPTRPFVLWTGLNDRWFWRVSYPIKCIKPLERTLKKKFSFFALASEHLPIVFFFLQVSFFPNSLPFVLSSQLLLFFLGLLVYFWRIQSPIHLYLPTIPAQGSLKRRDSAFGCCKVVVVKPAQNYRPFKPP